MEEEEVNVLRAFPPPPVIYATSKSDWRYTVFTHLLIQQTFSSSPNPRFADNITLSIPIPILRTYFRFVSLFLGEKLVSRYRNGPPFRISRHHRHRTGI